ncbi:hypothetical protein [Acinetobacter sp. P1(2025)]|uniref:hypothetical protein n=1 Tax=Acinetobacter sp. P1(2025) TaxID=3446120 RepID=UPI003F536E54
MSIAICTYRVDQEIWLGLESEFEKDSLHQKSNEMLDIHNCVLMQEDESEITMHQYMTNLIEDGLLTLDMLPCSLGSFLEQAIKRTDGKRQWRVLFGHLGDAVS